MRRIIIAILALLCLLAIAFFGWHYATSVEASNTQKLSEYISKKDKIQHAEVLTTKEEGAFFAAYYREGTSNRLIIFEKDSVFPNRYRYFGGGQGARDFNTYNFGQSAAWALIIVYGNNPGLEAVSYEFVNNAKTYHSPNLGEYILDIYRIENTQDITSSGCVYDRNGHVIDRF